jgi:peptide/nickel transport system ATP-binding protein
VAATAKSDLLEHAAVHIQPAESLLTVEDLTVSVPSGAARADAVRGASFTLSRGEIIGLVGESGSGKTLTCRSILGVLPPGCEVTGGRIVFGGTDLASLNAKGWEKVHGTRIGAIFQDPASYLNPSLSVGRQLAEVLRLKGGLSRAKARKRAVELFEAIGLLRPHFVYHQLPSELSGGMLQRVMIAIAISCNPELIVADEATTALDVVTQAEVIRLLVELRDSFSLSILFVSHDLAVVADLCERIVVFYGGEVVEVGAKDAIVSAPLHPYTDALLRVGSPISRAGKSETIPGQPPGVGEVRPGCRFAGRCAYEIDRCTQGPVPLVEVGGGRSVRCCRADELQLAGGRKIDA